MIVSGKKIVIGMFAVAIALCLWVRSMAPKLTVKDVPSVLPTVSRTKADRSYRTKMFPTMEQARTIAEKKINAAGSERFIITKYRAYDDGWIFDYESEKYLNSAKPKDRQNKTNTPVFVHKDGSAEFFSETSQTAKKKY